MVETSIGFDFVSILRGLAGICAVIAISYLLSFGRRKIDWELILRSITLQIILAFLILYVPFIGILVEGISKCFIKIMESAQSGLAFLLGPYASKKNGFIFLLHSLPVIIFFSALVSLCYHWGIIQKIVKLISWLLRRLLRISGAEGLVVSGNIFIGMSEAPVLIKEYLPKMNKSELFLVMVSGMGTIAGTVMGTYIGMLGGDNPQAQLLFAKHLLSASIMAAPASIAVAKIICPQTKKIETIPVEMNTRRYSNTLDAIAEGTMTGLKLMVSIAAMLFVFVSLVALANYITDGIIGRYTGLNDWISEVTGGKAQGLTFQFMLGIIMAPFMWLIGIPLEDIVPVGSLLGQKTILNEFVAYSQLQQWKEVGIFASEKSVIMSTYLLCGFANISSIGILLGSLSVLAPNKRKIISRLGFPAMVGGMLVSVLSAAVIGMFLN